MDRQRTGRFAGSAVALPCILLFGACSSSSTEAGSAAGQGTEGGTTIDGATADASGEGEGGGGATGCGFGATRDPLQQPFSSDSIWNMPIGSGATFASANVAAATGWGGFSVDEDVLVLTPTATAQSVYYQSSWTLPRCTKDGSNNVLLTLPMPDSLIIDDTDGTPNGCLAGLLADGRTIVSGQPFARCTAGNYATMTYPTDNVDLYSQGITGSHGGSGLSAYGGTLRVGELRPGGCPPRHALKLEFDGTANYAAGKSSSSCYAWPATQCDSDGPSRYAGANSHLVPGALVALPPTVTISTMGLETDVAAALAWTLQNYGAYVVDDTGWSVYQIATERGPAGSFAAQFQSDYGYSLDVQTVNPTDSSPASKWARDVNRLVGALSIITNNSSSSVGGGGAPLQPLAPTIAP